jgi:hypothetical protein
MLFWEVNSCSTGQEIRPFMESQGSLPCSQKSVIYLYTEPARSSSHLLQYFDFKMSFSLLFLFWKKNIVGLWNHLADCPPTNFYLCICWRGDVFTKPFPSNGRLFWLHYFGFQAVCHMAFKSWWTRCFIRGPSRIKYSMRSRRKEGNYFR